MRVRVTGKGLRRLESGRPVKYEQGAEFDCSYSFYEQHKARLTLLHESVEVERRGSAPEPPQFPPDQVITSDQVVDDSAPTLDQLRAEAADLGVDLDPRWKEKRLKAEIDKAAAAE